MREIGWAQKEKSVGNESQTVNASYLRGRKMKPCASAPRRAPVRAIQIAIAT